MYVKKLASADSLEPLQDRSPPPRAHRTSGTETSSRRETDEPKGPTRPAAGRFKERTAAMNETVTTWRPRSESAPGPLERNRETRQI